MWLHSVLRRIVRNDAIRVDPPEIYNWRVLALAASVSRAAKVVSSSMARFALTEDECRHASLERFSVWMLASLVEFSPCLISKGTYFPRSNRAGKASMG